MNGIDTRISAGNALTVPGPRIVDAGLLDYNAAWQLQLDLHAKVLSGELPGGAVMLVEHPPVITIGRHPGAAEHLLAAPDYLKQRGVQVVATDRGGDITFHGPGQLVIYPILPLNDHRLGLHAYLRLLEETIIGTLALFGVAGQRECGATGVWVPVDSGLAKICAIGVKLKRWTTLHGAALNVTTDLSYFALINPCGLGRPVTSLVAILGQAPPMEAVKTAVVNSFGVQLQRSLRAKTIG